MQAFGKVYYLNRGHAVTYLEVSSEVIKTSFETFLRNSGNKIGCNGIVIIALWNISFFLIQVQDQPLSDIVHKIYTKGCVDTIKVRMDNV